MPARRKRSVGKTAEIEGFKLRWTLRSEPQISSNGAEGLSIEVQRTDGTFRELILEYQYPKKGRKILMSGRFYSIAPNPPIRPALPAAMVESGIRQAIAAGWDPSSRGKPFVFSVPQP